MTGDPDLRRRKRAVRREVLAARDGLAEDARRASSAAIARLLLAMPELDDVDTVLAFASFRSEVDTAPILDGLAAREVRVCLPRIEGREMVAVVHRAGDALAAGPTGVPEPVGEGLLDAHAIDVIVVPGVAFDGAGGRLGYGGGYYDRYFRLAPRAARIAVGFEAQVVDAVPRGGHDLPIDALVTEVAVRRFPRRRPGPMSPST